MLLHNKDHSPFSSYELEEEMGVRRKKLKLQLQRQKFNPSPKRAKAIAYNKAQLKSCREEAFYLKQLFGED